MGTVPGGEGTSPCFAVSGSGQIVRATISGLTNGTSYYFKVSAYDNLGEGPESAELVAAPSTSTLPAPGAFTSVPLNSAVNLSWSSVSGATRYILLRGSTGLSSSLTGTTYADSGLSNGTAYTYSIYDVQGNAVSNSRTVTATPEPAPTSAPNLSATASSNTQVTLEWTTANGASSYNVFRGTTPGGEGSTAIATGLNTLTYADNTVVANTLYYYKVSGSNGYGIGPSSNEASAEPGVTRLSAPAGLTTIAGNARVLLYWSPVSNASYYNLYRCSGSGGFSLIQENLTQQTMNNMWYASGLVLTASDSSPSNGTTYTYGVTAVGLSGDGPMSTATATPTIVSLPAAPTFPAADYPGKSGSGTVQVGANLMSPTGNVSAYYDNLYRGTAPGAESPVPVQLMCNDEAERPEVTDSGLLTGTTYYYKMTQVMNAGNYLESPYSTEFSYTPGVTAPVAPVVNEEQGNLSWTLTCPGVSGASTYLIERATDESEPSVVAQLTGPQAFSYIDQWLPYGGLYRYVVAAVNQGGAGPWVNVGGSDMSGFGLLPTPLTLTVAQGSKATCRIAVTAADAGTIEYTGSVNLAVSGAPAGMLAWTYGGTVYTQPTGISESEDGQYFTTEGSTLYVVVQPSVPAGIYPITVTGTSGADASTPWTSSVIVNVTVTTSESRNLVSQTKHRLVQFATSRLSQFPLVSADRMSKMPATSFALMSTLQGGHSNVH